jgi:hypothetical protein
MPQWDFVCNKCGDPQTVLGKITEYEEIGLKENLCQVEGCDGLYEHTFEDSHVGHSWLTLKPTPRFHP